TLADAGHLTGVASYRGEYRFDEVHLRNGAGLSSLDPLSSYEEVVVSGAARLPALFRARSVRVTSGSVVTPAVGSGMRREVEETLTIEAGARLDAEGRGYAGGAAGQPGGGPSWVVAPTPDAGGAHGGLGIGWTIAGER